MPGAEPRVRAFAPAILSLFAAALLAPPNAPAAEAPHAVILLYHHVSEDTPPATSVTPATFEGHLDFLERNAYSVVRLDAVVAAISGAGDLPPKSVSLTFDDAYDSVYREALPRLERRGWPFTVFVATEPVDRGYSGFMTWDEMRDLERRGGTLANHGTSHAHLVRRRDDESDTAWARRVRADITNAESRLEDELARPLGGLFAYPYGEFDAALTALVGELGYVAFGQQSGPVGPSSGLRALPRFPVARGYDDLDSLAEKLRTRPLPVSVLSPASRILAPGVGPPTLRMRVPDGPWRHADLRCYVAGQSPALIEWRDDVAMVRARDPLGPGRSKYNCTVPSVRESGVFYWYSHLWIVPNRDGSWYSE